uniref:Anterior gradient 2 n=1 Tax=Eptatretus burgeri TaxID=7764 RepID=A0A8C4RCR1_EPTBU
MEASEKDTNMKFFIVFVACFIVVSANDVKKNSDKKTKKIKREPETLSRGWGDGLEWVQSYDEGLAQAWRTNKPLLVIHHRNDCPHSQALKKAFAQDEEIQKMAEDHFVMLNVMNELSDKNMQPDEMAYVPRILFVDPSMAVRADIVGRYGHRLYAYDPADIELLRDNMKKAKKLLKSEL